MSYANERRREQRAETLRRKHVRQVKRGAFGSLTQRVVAR